MNFKLVTFRRNQVLIIVILNLLCTLSYGQTPIEIKKYICDYETHTELIYDAIKGRESDDVCDQGTKMHVTPIGDDIYNSITVERMDNGPHRAKVIIDWKPDAVGSVAIKVYYERREHKGWFGCGWEPWTYMYTYVIEKGSPNPAGHLAVDNDLIVSDGTTFPQVELTYHRDPDYPQDVAYMKWYVNSVYQGLLSSFDEGSDNFRLRFNPTQLGTYVITTETINFCSQWLTGPSKTITIEPSCYKDNPSGISLLPVGPGLTYNARDGSYTVTQNQEYALSVSGITDMSSHYDITTDGGADVVLNGMNFTVTTPLGGYHITMEPKAGRQDACPSPRALTILVGGENIVLEQNCPIVLPDDIGELGYEIDPDNVIFQHFTFSVISKRNITVKPGITLELGAEVELELPDPSTEGDVDADMNFIESVAYNEYGQVLSNSRSYFDNNGQALQSQHKNLAEGVVMTKATLYDAYDRPVISTLPAPTGFVTDDTANDECEESVPNTERLNFTFKEDFVKASTEGQPIYDYTHFDAASTELNPVPVDGSSKGTLGWYYSTNNDIEPLVATTQFPYSRSLFHHDGSGEVKGNTKPGDLFKAGSDYITTSNNEIVVTNDAILLKYLSIRQSELGFANGLIEGQFFKSVTIDEEGMRSETYTDKSGKKIISLYYADQQTPLMKSYQFYDILGRLLVSITPNGVEAYERTPPHNVPFADIDKTKYFYNAKGQLSALEEKDGGRTEYIYRKDGAIRFSQNQKQRDVPPARYSYTNYDNAGRAIESGEFIPNTGGIEFNSAAMVDILENVDPDGGLPANLGIKKDRVSTFYDEITDVPGEFQQRFVNGAVSYTRNENVTTYYSYDETGRAEWIVQDILGLGVKTVHYRYGPSGDVQEVLYQKGNASEQFSHFYLYDTDGRLKQVYTTTSELQYNKFGELLNSDGLDLQATYYYYLHGPLKRIELAGNLQGIDYVYTIDGALKSINSANPASSEDPGGDGSSGQSPAFRKDVFGMSLEYFHGDYLGANGRTDNATIPLIEYPEQHGGLIRAMRWHSPIEAEKQLAYAYQYDNRYQFKQANWGTIAANTFTNSVADTHIPSTNKEGSYLESISGYDLNGNISTLNRKNSVADNIANFKYEYDANSNRLDKILDIDDDLKVIKDYSYTTIGELESEIGKQDEPQKHIVYDVSGKVKAVYRDAAKAKLAVEFSYDDRGFRLSKTGYNEEGVAVARTWYVRDASGNVMATYEQDIATSQESELTEVSLFGEGRVGFYKPQFGFYQYEINDHLGNVRAVIGNSVTKEYLATMESERFAKEDADFEKLSHHPTATDFNHTPATVEVDGTSETITNPNEVNRLNNMPVSGEPTDPVGAGIEIWVHPGDVIEAEVYVKYTDFNSNNEANLPLAATLLANIFTSAPVGVDGASIFGAVEQPEFLAWPAWDELDDDQPRAFLNCLLFDNDGKLQWFDFDQVSSSAKITGSGPHEKLTLRVEAKKEGFIYIFVSNHSNQNTEVYFDDLRINHTYSDIVAGGDFYPFGLAINDRQIERDFYRHGYQGSFSEKDQETGWNHFELREYDPTIARWVVPDPQREFSSPYIAFGNDPINKTDPDGGCTGDCPPEITYVQGDCMCSSYDENFNPVTFIPEPMVVNGLSIGQIPVGFPVMEAAPISTFFFGDRDFNGQPVGADGSISGIFHPLKLEAPMIGGPRAAVPLIKSLQVGLRDPKLVSKIAGAMRTGTYEFKAARGIIAGFVDSKGIYYISEGNHRMAAAMKVFRESGNSGPIKQLIQNGRWTQVTKAPVGARPLPSTTWWGSFRNWIGY